MISINAAFDSGNIEIVDARDPSAIRLNIRADKDSDFYQWFHFKLSGVEGEEVTIRIENAAGAAYPDGWPGYQACASVDRESWHRVQTTYEDGVLTIRFTPERSPVWLAYFAPYSYERHQELIGFATTHPAVAHHVLGHSLDGRDIDLLEIGEPGPGKRTVWMIARQHPGETMAEWWMEGMLERLLDPADGIGRKLLAGAHLFVVPNINPDGSVRGHLRTNAAGINLNREWNAPSMEKSPEVFLVREKMLATGVDFHLDVHGDEGLPYNFIAGFESVPSVTERQLALLDRFKTSLATLSPEFQTEHGYPVEAPGTSDLKKCTDWTAETFGCLAMTLEMPFKDAISVPEPEEGWSPARSKQLGADCLAILAGMLDDLR